MRSRNFEEYMKDLNTYLEEVVKKETPEESKRKLIKTGVLDENGKMK